MSFTHPQNSAEAYTIIQRLTPRQQDVLSALAIGQDEGHHPKTLQALAAKGLIESDQETLPGRLPVIIQRYYVPLFVHIAWAQWGSEQCTEEDVL
jgi:hypothetical protein